VARNYGIRSALVNVYELMPDVREVERKMWDECEKIVLPSGN